MDTAPTAQLLEPEIRELVVEGRFAELRVALGGLDPVEVADLLLALEVSEAAVAFRFLPRGEAADVFSHLDPDNQEKLIAALGETAAGHLVEAMSPDDRVALLDELPTEVTTRLLNALSPESRRVTQTMLGYPDDTVGRLMTPDYVRVRPEWSVEKALRHIRRWGHDAETVHWIFVIDRDGALIDDIHIRPLLLADPAQTIAHLMDHRFICLNATDDQEEAVRTFAKYDRTALPVVDAKGALVGIVTVDDIADVAEEEVTEDFQKQAGMEALERPYLQAGLFEMIRKRGGVLSVLLIAQSFTIGVLGLFERQLEAAEFLVLFIPLIIACGGNTGTQAASLLIRALALGELTPGDWAKVVLKELASGLGVGLLLGALAVVAVQAWNLTPHVEAPRPWMVGLCVGGAVVAIVVWAVTVGSMFPLLLERLKFDPATISSPLVATLMDVSGLIIYLAVAMGMMSVGLL